LTTDAASLGQRWWGFVALLYYGTARAVKRIFGGLAGVVIYDLWSSRSNLTGNRGLRHGTTFNLPTFQPSTLNPPMPEGTMSPTFH
jgi:hypothetical protein